MKNFFRQHKIVMILSIVLALVMVSGGGYYVGARFSDQGSVQTTVTSGTFDLRVNGSDTTQATSVSDMLPGQNRTVSYTLKNVGSAKGEIQNIDLAFAQEGGIYTDAEARAGDATNAGNLGEFLQYEVYDGSDNLIGSGTLSGIIGSNASGTDHAVLSAPLVMNSGAQTTLKVKFLWPWVETSTDNKAQGDKLTVSATIYMNQVQTA